MASDGRGEARHRGVVWARANRPIPAGSAIRSWGPPFADGPCRRSVMGERRLLGRDRGGAKHTAQAGVRFARAETGSFADHRQALRETPIVISARFLLRRTGRRAGTR